MDSRLRTVFLVDVAGCSLEEPAFRRCGRRSPFLFVCSETPGRRSRGWHQESLPWQEGTDKVPATATVQHAVLVCAARARLPLGAKVEFLRMCRCVELAVYRIQLYYKHHARHSRSVPYPLLHNLLLQTRAI